MMRIAAIILTYHPDMAVLQAALRAVLPQVAGVLLVDNGSGWDESEARAGLDPGARAKAEILRLETNLGVGAGHNRGIGWARAQGFSHVLILDHDSIPAPDMVEKLSAALDALATRGTAVAAVGPRWVDRYTGHAADFLRLGALRMERVTCRPDARGELVETDFIISSGALIPLAVLDAVGGMNEGFFIDHVDTEWIFRARARGYRSFGVCDAVMEHSLGTATLRFWLGRWRHVPLHSPERHYYVFRNGVMLLRMPHAPRRWVKYDVLRLAAMALVFPLFAPDRLRRIRLMARGLRDGLRGATGPLG